MVFPLLAISHGLAYAHRIARVCDPPYKAHPGNEDKFPQIYICKTDGSDPAECATAEYAAGVLPNPLIPKCDKCIAKCIADYFDPTQDKATDLVGRGFSGYIWRTMGQVLAHGAKSFNKADGAYKLATCITNRKKKPERKDDKDGGGSGDCKVDD